MVNSYNIIIKIMDHVGTDLHPPTRTNLLTRNSHGDSRHFISNIIHAATSQQDIRLMNERLEQSIREINELGNNVVDLEKKIIILERYKVDHEVIGKLKEDYEKAVQKHAHDVLEYEKKLKVHASSLRWLVGLKQTPLPKCPMPPPLNLESVSSLSHTQLRKHTGAAQHEDHKERQPNDGGKFRVEMGPGTFVGTLGLLWDMVGKHKNPK